MKKVRYTTNQFISRAQIVHGDTYDYSQVVYINTRTKVSILCHRHGLFEQTPNAHISQKQGCPSCGTTRCVTTRLRNIPTFVESAISIHGNTYDYSLVEYVDRHTPVCIKCERHGLFNQRPNDHLKGSGCPECGRLSRAMNNTLTTEDFIQRAKDVHGTKYDYSRTSYKSLHVPVEIICPTHGMFLQTPNNHVHNTSGCPKCVHTTSHKEQHWLDMQGIPNTPKHRQVKINVGTRWFRVDGFDPHTNTVYEFLGDFWHGNPQVYQHTEENVVTRTTFGCLYTNTMNKLSALKEAGYNVEYVWERDFIM